jgi:DNA-binding winged helix-turn-helix (wHTH) protein/TolB-like protein
VSATGDRRYGFGSFDFDAAAGELRGPDGAVQLRPQAALVLELLLAKPGEIVTKEELRRALWPDERVVMFEASIAAVIRELRRIFGDDPRSPRYIETISRRGYRFVGPAARMPPSGAAHKGRRPLRGRFPGAAIALAMVAAVLLAAGLQRYLPDGSAAPEQRPMTVAILPFDRTSAPAAGGPLAEAVARHLVVFLGTAVPDLLDVLDATAFPEQGGEPHRSVDYVVRGSVREDGDTLVVSARLLTGADGRFVWGSDYPRTSPDESLTAREVAARIADSTLSATLPARKKGSAAAGANAQAAAAYRRGEEALETLSREGAVEAVEAFRQATALEPGFAAPYARLAEALLSWAGPPVTAERVERAQNAARRAIELEPTLALGHRVLGEIALFFDRDWPLAGRYLERSVELAPADGPGHQAYAAWLSARGRHEEALRQIDLARALDPGSVAISIDVMVFHYYAREFEETIRAARRLQKLWPGNEGSYRYVILSRLELGDVAGAASEARARLAAGTAADGPSPNSLTDAEALDEYWAASLRVIARHVREASGDPTALAMLYVQAGRLEEALAELEAAMSVPRFSYLLPYLGVSPAFDGMCGVPRFEQALRRLRQSALDGERLVRCESAASLAGG